MWDNDQGPKDWFAVCNDDGIKAYFGDEADAFRWRLDMINRELNPWSEAMIICPMADNTGALRPNVYRGARDACITAFNGCTIRYAEGYWRGDDGKLFMENVAELMVVCNDDAANRAKRSKPSRIRLVTSSSNMRSISAILTAA